jgi:hypothetical protein
MRIVLISLALPVIAAACGGGGNATTSGDGGGSDGTAGGDGGGSGSGGSSGGQDGGVSSSGGDGGGSSSSGGGDGGAEAGGPQIGASVVGYHNHVNRDGYFQDPLVTATSAAKFALDATFKATFTDTTLTTPLYVENGPGGKGTFYVATGSNNLYAFDETTGAQAWPVKNFGTAATNSGAGCGNVHPIGILGTPAIDLATRLIVFDAASANAGGNIATHTIYGVSIDDGSTKWSVDVSTLKDPTGLAFSPQPQNQRSAVLIVGGIAYVAFGGHSGDCGNYHGWVVGVPLSGSGAKAWATKVGKAGIWAPGGPSSDGQSVFVATGNGNAPNASWAESEGIFRLDPGPSFTGQTADYFAPNNWSTLDQGDVDISGSGPLVIDAPSLSPSALLMAQGKDGWLYLMNRANLGGITAAANTANVGAIHVSSGEFINGGASATVGGTTYVVVRPNSNQAGVGCPNGTAGDLVAVKLDPAAAQKMSVAWCANSQGNGSPIITSSDGTHDGLVWVFGAEGTNLLHAWDLATGAAVFGGGGTANGVQGGHRFASLLVEHGRIVLATDGGLHAFKGP